MKHLKTMVACYAATLALNSAHADVLAHYSFDTGYTDSSGNAFNGMLVEGYGIPTTSVQPDGGATPGTIGNSLIDTSIGNFKFGGGSMYLSTDRDYLSVPLATFANGTAWSIAFWAQVAAPVAGEAASAATFDMVMGNISDNSNFIALGQASTSRFRNTGNTYSQDFSAGGVGNGWNHFALVADGLGGFKVYQNNSLLTSATGKNTAFSYNAIGEAYSVNTTANDFDFHGNIDEVWVFNNAIDASTINNLYSVNAVPEPATISVMALGYLWVLSGLRRRKVKYSSISVRNE